MACRKKVLSSLLSPPSSRLAAATARAFCQSTVESIPNNNNNNNSVSTSEEARATRLNHVAVAVPDIARAANKWRALAGPSAVSWPPQRLPEHGVSVVFVQLGNVKIELLEALGDKSPIRGFLEKHKRGGIHHLCLEVPSAEAALAAARARGQRALTDRPSPGAHGTPVGFLHPADFDGCLLEVEEVK